MPAPQESQPARNPSGVRSALRPGAKAPSAPVERDGPSLLGRTFSWLFPRRIGRLRYFLSYLFIFIFIGVWETTTMLHEYELEMEQERVQQAMGQESQAEATEAFPEDDAPGWTLGHTIVAGLILLFRVQRLHDLGLSGWAQLEFYRPISLMYLEYKLWTLAGDGVENEFGPAPG